jgi:alpha-tubulin suppressor-like RCC1 family protein
LLTNCGEVYAWGRNSWGQIGNGCNDYQLIPIKVKGFNNERVVMISCGAYHSMALTECGHVYSWGYNGWGQLGNGNNVNSYEPKFVIIIDENVFIEKISCGSFHSLLLSSDGYIYVFGRNKNGELGNQKDFNFRIKRFFHKEGNELSPYKLKIETKFIDISSRWNEVISIALSQNGIYYIWGKCGEESIQTPKPTNFKSFVEIYAKYFKITHKAINIEEQNSVPILLREQENILKTQIRPEEENGEKVKANKTEYNLGSAVNRFNSQPNVTLSRYKSDFKQLELIGIGGFGKVYKVINRLDQQQYAVKIILLKGIYKSNSHHL